MADPKALYPLSVWLSAAAPLGGFAYSHGLDAAHWVRDSDALTAWLRGLTRHGGLRQDAILCAQAMKGADLSELAALAAALAPSAERRRETLDQGAAFARMAAAWGVETPAAALPVAAGGAARAIQAAPDAALTLYLSNALATFTQNATRLFSLGQTQAQTILAALTPAVLDVVDEALSADLDDLGGCALAADIASMAHETQNVRLFLS